MTSTTRISKIREKKSLCHIFNTIFPFNNYIKSNTFRIANNLLSTYYKGKLSIGLGVGGRIVLRIIQRNVKKNQNINSPEGTAMGPFRCSRSCSQVQILVSPRTFSVNDVF